MRSLKGVLGDYLKGKQVHYTCTCLFSLDVIGVIEGYRVENNEIIFTLATAGKKIEFGENTAHAKLEIL